MIHLGKKSVADQFEHNGYLVVRKLAKINVLRSMNHLVHKALNPLQGPAEYEADVGYPGAPISRDGIGGHTPRRLLHAYSRDEIFRRWAAAPSIVDYLRQLTGQPDHMLSQCHHNCVMCKHPGFSSSTAWHQDMRYWSFDKPDLISVWLALGSERQHNGALWIIPGSHKLSLGRGRFDANLFLRSELRENQELFNQAVMIELEPGDTFFFHCRLFHAAGTNESKDVKLATVFTYHTLQNKPIPGTRSNQFPSIPV